MSNESDERRIARELEERRRELSASLETLTATPLDPMAAVSFGKRVGDGTTQAVERINQTSTARSLAATLADVERALAKLAEGTYGICDKCGAVIPAERLEAIPWTALCVDCSRSR